MRCDYDDDEMMVVVVEVLAKEYLPIGTVSSECNSYGNLVDVGSEDFPRPREERPLRVYSWLTVGWAPPEGSDEGEDSGVVRGNFKSRLRSAALAFVMWGGFSP